MIIKFNEWVFFRELDFNEESAVVKTLYHGSTLDHVESIMSRGVIHQIRDWSVNEFWATDDLNKAKIFAHVQSDVENVNDPPPLGVFKFDLPLAVIKIIKREGMLFIPEPGVYEFNVNSFTMLNEYMTNRKIIPIKAHSYAMA